MDFASFALPALILLVLSSLAVLLIRNWRWSILSLALMYLGVFLLIADTWPVDLAAVKLVTGWMACSVLGITRINLPSDDEHAWPMERVFRFLAATLVISVVATFVPYVIEWIPVVTPIQAWGGLLLIGMGMLHLGFSSKPMRVIFSLLTFLAGFEILYAVVEDATLVAGLLALVDLGIALAGAYLLILPGLGEAEA